jgi:hypothetical protein
MPALSGSLARPVAFLRRSARVWKRSRVPSSPAEALQRDFFRLRILTSEEFQVYFFVPLYLNGLYDIKYRIILAVWNLAAKKSEREKVSFRQALAMSLRPAGASLVERRAIAA